MAAGEQLHVCPSMLEPRCLSCFADRMQRLLRIFCSASWPRHASLYGYRIFLHLLGVKGCVYVGKRGGGGQRVAWVFCGPMVMQILT